MLPNPAPELAVPESRNRSIRQQGGVVVGFVSGCVEPKKPDDRHSSRKVVPRMYRGMCRQRTNHVLVAYCMV